MSIFTYIIGSEGGGLAMVPKFCSKGSKYSNRTIKLNNCSSVAADFDACGMARAGGYNLFSFFFFALQPNFLAFSAGSL